MFSKRFLKTASTLALATFALGACSFNKVDTGVFRIPTEEQGRITLDTDAFEGVTPTRVNYADSRITEEYVLYRSQQGQAELFFAETLPLFEKRTVLDFDKLVSTATRMWRFNQGHTLNFQESYSIDNAFATFWVQLYRQAETGRDCAGFASQWAIRMDDPDLRPSKVMFGFYCAPKGMTFSKADATQFVKSIQIRGISVPLRVESVYAINKKTPPPGRDTQMANMVTAQDGAGGGVAGLPEFPLLIWRQYNNYDRECVNC